MDLGDLHDFCGPWTEHMRQRLHDEGMIWLSELSTKESEANAYERLLRLTNSDTAVLCYLFAVIIHVGSAHEGHYNAFIRDEEGLGKWEAPTTTPFAVEHNSVSLANKRVLNTSTAAASSFANPCGRQTIGRASRAVPHKRSELPDPDLLASRWGRWFDFNDTRVTPIHVQDIGSVFEGRESAYMLIHRTRQVSTSRGTRAAATVSSASASGLCTTEALAQRVQSVHFHGVKCPAVWVKQVEKQHHINVKISSPGFFAISNDGLILSPNVDTETSFSAEFESMCERDGNQYL